MSRADFIKQENENALNRARVAREEVLAVIADMDAMLADPDTTEGDRQATILARMMVSQNLTTIEKQITVLEALGKPGARRVVLNML